MKTKIIAFVRDPEAAINAAVQCLQNEELVGVPTETVYGLAGSALSVKALSRIFEAKQRPYFDPLIIHVAQREWVEELTPAFSEPLSAKLMDRFWPGPLTILFPKGERVPDLVTGGLKTVAIRMPHHPVLTAILGAFGKPVAAPSANQFGRVSPTTADHVYAELKGRIPLIVDAGPTQVGVESTVVRVVSGRVEILRPGPVTEEMLREVCPIRERRKSGKIEAPGQTASHYAPKKPVHISASLPQNAETAALLCWGPIHSTDRFRLVRSLSEERNLHEAAHQLFALLRELDQSDATEIYVEPVPEEGIGKAIMNRLRRASSKNADSPGIADNEKKR
jgi:L-threonylcarbamoyladenylate synthase